MLSFWCSGLVGNQEFEDCPIFVSVNNHTKNLLNCNGPDPRVFTSQYTMEKTCIKNGHFVHQKRTTSYIKQFYFPVNHLNYFWHANSRKL